MSIKDCCTKNVQYVGPETSLRDIAKLMKAHDCGSILIGENDKLSGVVTDRDIVVRALADNYDSDTTKAGEIMTAEVLYCFEDDSKEDILMNMAENGVRRMPVVNNDKNLIGIVSFGDLSAACDNKEAAGEAMKKIRLAS